MRRMPFKKALRWILVELLGYRWLQSANTVSALQRALLSNCDNDCDAGRLVKICSACSKRVLVSSKCLIAYRPEMFYI
ncbi:hypothetical protein Tcan_05502 [Toxocara canis]|uniref:Secreted protein n=1 Tax=Toxocara canis TaxID=6265 RepID=A0A0B2VHJ7_TOXCA|nr:hypothetical protein Tcan_05502 [Toxocara canis]